MGQPLKSHVLTPIFSLLFSGLKLGEYISHFEPAFYSRESVSRQHAAAVSSSRRRRKRSIANGVAQPDLAFNFTAHNR